MDDKLYTGYEGENVRAALPLPEFTRPIFLHTMICLDNRPPHMVNRLNNWKPEQVSGLELEVADLGSMNSVKEEIRERVDTQVG